MEDRIEQLEAKTAKIEARMKSHWALQTDDDFADNYLKKIRNDLQSSIMKMAIGAIVLLAGSGFIFIKYAVNEQFNKENNELIAKLQHSYDTQIERTDDNFEWRRFHDYGKEYVYLSEFYSKAPIAEDTKKAEIHKLLSEAEKYFNDALSHGDMHASTYWELGELYYTYRNDLGLPDEVDKLKAVLSYKDAASRYTEAEIKKGWRSEAYLRIGNVYWDLHDDVAIDPSLRKTYSENAKEYLLKANSEYAQLTHLTDDRTKDNIKKVASLLHEVEGTLL